MFFLEVVPWTIVIFSVYIWEILECVNWMAENARKEIALDIWIVRTAGIMRIAKYNQAGTDNQVCIIYRIDNFNKLTR